MGFQNNFYCVGVSNFVSYKNNYHWYFFEKKIVINDNKYKVIDADLNEYIAEI